ncbi:MAG: efflux RND transporter periplasmic adaptor subunit [Bosea sp. (in: a-proteobacteria)]
MNILTSLLIAGLAAGATTAHAQTGDKAAAGKGAVVAPSVSVAAAMRGAIAETIIVGGTLVAREDVLLAAQVEGLAIVEILVEEGTSVKAGQVLARLSRDTTEAALAQNSAQLARAEAAIAQSRNAITEAEAAQVAAANSFSRTRQLRSEGIASAEAFDQRESTARQTAARVASTKEQLKLAEADLALTRANRRDLEIRLARTEIKAPVDGLISRRSARVGAIASGAGEPMFRLIENGSIELEADVAEASLARIRQGQSVKIRPAGFAQDVDGKVRLVSSEVSRSTRLGRVRITLADSTALTIGAFARGQIEVARSQGVLVPLSAVQFGQTGTQVQVIKATQGDGRHVEARIVKTGLRQNGQVEIIEGLQAGEQIVLIAGSFLRHGDRVSPVLVNPVAPPATTN